MNLRPLGFLLLFQAAWSLSIENADTSDDDSLLQMEADTSEDESLHPRKANIPVDEVLQRKADIRDEVLQRKADLHEEKVMKWQGFAAKGISNRSNPSL